VGRGLGEFGQAIQVGAGDLLAEWRCAADTVAIDKLLALHRVFEEAVGYRPEFARMIR
jgi:hypothetical protein